MRVIDVEVITDAVRAACIEINTQMDPRIREQIHLARSLETVPRAEGILSALLENADIAQRRHLPLCQDTGMVVAFVTLGQSVQISGGRLTDAVWEGVRRGYTEGYLRASVVSDPLMRVNTGDNTPGVIHYDVVEGDVFEIHLSAKGFGSENMSVSRMLSPSDGEDGVVETAVQAVICAGGKPCPPIVLGIGIGGTLDYAAVIAKRALMRPLGEAHPEPHIAALERRILEQLNATGIGPQGLGGDTTAFAVHIETYPTHIAGLPVVVNINCHASRHAKIVL